MTTGLIASRRVGFGGHLPTSASLARCRASSGVISDVRASSQSMSAAPILTMTSASRIPPAMATDSHIRRQSSTPQTCDPLHSMKQKTS